MPQSPRKFEVIREGGSEADGKVELEGHGCTVPNPLSSQSISSLITPDAVAIPAAQNQSTSLGHLITSATLDMTSSSCATFHSTSIAKSEAPEQLARTLLPSRSPPGKTTMFDQQSLATIRSAIHLSDPQSCHASPVKNVLPQMSLAKFGSTSEISAARRRRPHRPVRNVTCSESCVVGEAVFPTRKWTKALADMGDTMSWKIGVLDKIYAIQY